MQQKHWTDHYGSLLRSSNEKGKGQPAAAAQHYDIIEFIA